MKTLSAYPTLSGGSSAFCFEAARALAKYLAKSDCELPTPDMIARLDRPTTMASSLFGDCSGSDGWQNYGDSHVRRLETDADDEMICRAGDMA